MRRFLILGLLGLASGGMVGCQTLSGFLGNRQAAVLPPCVQDDCDCGDFRDQPLAQTVLKAYWGDPYGLDRDGNGQACESLPTQLPAPDPPAPPGKTIHLTLGNPSNAGQQNLANYLIERDQYSLAYNRDRNLANWVSWQLDASWLGRTDRQENFRPDGALPRGVYQVTAEDYWGSGYDRGHLVPSADRTANVEDNGATFLMTNIIPQAAENNRGPWRELESYTRDLVYQFDRELFIMAGAYGQQGKIGARQLVVPSRLWKIIVVMDQPGMGPTGVYGSTQVIAVDMPNRDTVDPDWRRYQTSIDSIELATGYDFLSQVPVEVQAILEARKSSE